MIVDYYDIGRVVQPIIAGYLDHWHLNDTLQTDRPTSEFIARWAYERLKPLLPALVAVTISETCTTSCRYAPLPYVSAYAALAEGVDRLGQKIEAMQPGDVLRGGLQ